jgi:hypothetical protein
MTSKIIVNNIQSDTGISTITISSPIALSGGVTGGGFAVGTGASISSPETNVLTVSTNNVERIRVGAAGSIGIGTDNPTKLIDMSGVHSGINTTGRFVMSPHSAGWDTGVTSGSIHHHYANNFRLYSGQIGSGTERFNVDSSGRMTLPYQPSFRTGRSTNYSPGANTDIVFNSTANTFHHNVGGHYSTSTGRFTCPISGRYFFTACIIWGGGLSNQNLADAAGLNVNGGLACYSFRRAAFISGTTGGTDGYYTDHLSCIVNLNVNDYVTIRNYFNIQVHGNELYCWFAGHLLG